MNKFSDDVEHCIPVELFFDSNGKDDVRNHLIKKGHFIVLTDNSIDGGHDKNDDINGSLSTIVAVEAATPSQEETGGMWKPSPRKANTDPLPQLHPLVQSHNQLLSTTSPSSMWKPSKLAAPTSLSFSEH